VHAYQSVLVLHNGIACMHCQSMSQNQCSVPCGVSERQLLHAYACQKNLCMLNTSEHDMVSEVEFEHMPPLEQGSPSFLWSTFCPYQHFDRSACTPKIYDDKKTE